MTPLDWMHDDDPAIFVADKYGDLLNLALVADEDEQPQETPHSAI